MITLDSLVIKQGSFSLGASFDVQRAEIVAVIGPSGAGKSTLLNALAGFLPVASGKVHIDGKDVSKTDPGLRPVAMIFQDSNLFPHLSIAQNIGLGLRPSINLNGAERAKVEAALKAVGMDDLGHRRPAELSGGQQSRAALARAILQDRPVLLLDEPFAALGPALRAEMLDLVKQIATQRGLTVLMITHDPSDARRIADKAILVADGVAEAPADLAELLDSPPPALRAYLGQ